MDDSKIAQRAREAEAYALKLLGGRAKSRAQLQQALERRGFTEDEAAPVVEKLVTLRYLDDEALAQARAASMVREGKWGPARMVERLVSQGIEPARAQRAVARGMEQEGRSALETARAALARRGLQGARAARFLAQRGFDEDTLARLDLVPSDG